jgi:hypothetical protein
MVAVPAPAIGTLRMRLLEASSVPVTAKDCLDVTQVLRALGYGMSDPVTKPLEIWSAPVNIPTVVELVP